MSMSMEGHAVCRARKTGWRRVGRGLRWLRPQASKCMGLWWKSSGDGVGDRERERGERRRRARGSEQRDGRWTGEDWGRVRACARVRSCRVSLSCVSRDSASPGVRRLGRDGDDERDGGDGDGDCAEEQRQVQEAPHQPHPGLPPPLSLSFTLSLPLILPSLPLSLSLALARSLAHLNALHPTTLLFHAFPLLLLTTHSRFLHSTSPLSGCPVRDAMAPYLSSCLRVHPHAHRPTRTPKCTSTYPYTHMHMHTHHLYTHTYIYLSVCIPCPCLPVIRKAVRSADVAWGLVAGAG
eukprot:2904789-Rhodomonas_salina.2